MKKEYRLVKNEDFKNVLDFRKYVSRENFTIYHKPNDLGHCRVGVSVSSKIGNSVIRHKVKRQITSMLDKCVNVDDSYDIVVIARKKYLESKYIENYNDMTLCINKLLRKGKKENESK